jgi:colanic acid/amylovoran biosynthesis protein
MNVLIIGANFSNKGAEAMMLTVKQQIKERYKQARLYMLCRGYEEKLALENGLIPVYKQDHGWGKRIRQLYKRALGKMHKLIFKEDKPYVFPFPFSELRSKVPKIDVVIDVSGFAYADSWGVPVVEETIKLQRLYGDSGTLFYFMPQAWGSFHKPGIAKAVREMLVRANKFYARDPTSQKYLSELLDIPPKKIPLMHDIAFAYYNCTTANETENFPGIKNDANRLIGISPNVRIYERSQGVDGENAYVQMLLALANYCTQSLNAEVIFIPNEVFPDGVKARDDRHLCRVLMSLVSIPEKCLFKDQYYSAQEIYNLIGSVDLLISSRFHALIFGFLQEKPVMAISWSHKYRELFSLFGLEKFVLESNEMNQDDTIRLLNKLLEEKANVELKIKESITRLKTQVTEVFDEIAAVIPAAAVH